MIQSRLSRPAELGSRIDSPMRDESRPAQGSTSSVSSLLSPPREQSSEGQTIKITYKMSHGSPTSGFTAVNGDANRNTSFRPDERAIGTTHFVRKDDALEHAATPHQVHSWRPDERPTTQSGDSENSISNKRKRVETEKDEASSNVHEDRLGATGSEGSKRRGGAAITPAATTLTPTAPEQINAPPSSAHIRERPPTGRYEREPSPIFMKDRGAPPPPPRPEVAAGLAESLQRELAAAQDNQQYISPTAQSTQHHASPGISDNRRQTSTVEKSASPADDSYDQQQSPPYESENGQNGDADDSNSKKRKRNFSNRTKTGCHTCRARKKKCDENKPVCHNCQRGGFDCGGYGPKPPGGTKVSAARPLTTIKPAYEPSHGPSQFHIGSYYDNRPRPPPPPYEQPNYGHPPPPRPDLHTLPPVHHYNHPHAAPPAEHRPRDPYTTQYAEPSPYADRFPPHGLPPPPPPPPAEYGSLAPYRAFPDPSHPSHHRTPSAPSAPPPPPALPRYGPLDQYPGPPGPPTTISSKDSGSSSNSSGQRSRPGLVYRSGEKIGRSKMITGEPCSYFTDKALINERSSCKELLERYNDADKTTSGVPMEHKGVIFSQLVNPKERNDYGHSWDGPIGSIGDRVVVQAPFSCEYGYNLHFGDETMIMRNCLFQDAATISIGSHVTVGPGCHFLTLVSPTSSGPHGLHSTGAIRIEDGCTIGGNVTILPFRTIGKGATVVAGSVVTKDVKPSSIVAGNPAKPLREVDEVVEKENAKALKEMQNGTWRREIYV